MIVSMVLCNDTICLFLSVLLKCEHFTRFSIANSIICSIQEFLKQKNHTKDHTLCVRYNLLLPALQSTSILIYSPPCRLKIYSKPKIRTYIYVCKCQTRSNIKLHRITKLLAVVSRAIWSRLYWKDSSQQEKYCRLFRVFKVTRWLRDSQMCFSPTSVETKKKPTHFRCVQVNVTQSIILNIGSGFKFQFLNKQTV